MDTKFYYFVSNLRIYITIFVCYDRYCTFPLRFVRFNLNENEKSFILVLLLPTLKLCHAVRRAKNNTRKSISGLNLVILRERVSVSRVKVLIAPFAW